MLDATPPRATLPCSADGWAILGEPPGRRDLGEPAYWHASTARSQRRRNVRREPRLVAGGRAKLSLALAAAAVGGPAAGVASASTSGLGIANLSVGSRGAAVTALQRELGITADGVFGPQTRAAVVRFQRAHGVPATGLVGPLTRAALGQDSSTSDSSGTGASTPSAAAPVTATMSRATIKAMQSALGVTADGVIGPQTRAALKSFEATHGLTADGKPDSVTLQALGVTPGSTGTTPTTAPTTPSAPSSSAQTAVQAALSKVGDPYSYGAVGPSSFDCSGLVMWAFRQAGVTLPHSSYAQYGMGKAVSGSAIQAGDLVFFNTAGSGASDVGIATSSTTAVSATTHGVMTHPIRSGYWGSHFVGARRLG